MLKRQNSEISFDLSYGHLKYGENGLVQEELDFLLAKQTKTASIGGDFEER